MPKPLSSLAQLVAQILGDPRPVVFTDTCSLLDVPRGMFRSGFGATHVSTASDVIHRSAQVGGDIWLLTSEQVDLEYHRHEQDVFGEVEASLTKLHDAARILATSADVARLDHELAQTAVALQGLMDFAWRECLCIAHHTNMIAAANARLASGYAPGRKAGRNVGDCLVWESFIELCGALRKNGFSQRLIFVSFNKDDFGTPRAPKSNLAAELAKDSIDFLADLGSASALIGPRR